MSFHRITKSITKFDRARYNNQKSGVIWFTGLSGSGKTTLSRELELWLFQRGYRCYVLDGDNIRTGLCSDLGFDDKCRSENIRRIAEISRLFVDAGIIVVAAIISPFAKDRVKARQMFEPTEFVQVYLNTSLEICEKRDTKGLYAKARKGELARFTGINSIYEPPDYSEVVLDTSTVSVTNCLRNLVSYLESNGFIDASRS